MGMREKINGNRGLMSAVAIIVIVAAAWYGIRSSTSGRSAVGYGRTAYFTDDDGKSYFVDDISTIVPYTKNGKQVVRAHVFKCPSKGTFVGFLQRYTPDAVEAMKEAQEAAKAGREPKNLGLVTLVDTLGSEYKRPGAANPWKKGNSGDVVAGDIMALCDNKPGEHAENVYP